MHGLTGRDRNLVQLSASFRLGPADFAPRLSRDEVRASIDDPVLLSQSRRRHRAREIPEAALFNTPGRFFAGTRFTFMVGCRLVYGRLAAL